jgi:hypothetical protein
MITVCENVKREKRELTEKSVRKLCESVELA